MEPTVRKGEDEMRQRGRRNRAQGEADRERQRAVRRDERAGEEREPDADHERSRQPFGAAAPGDKACAHERDSRQNRERRESGGVVTHLPVLNPDRTERRARGRSDADRNAEQAGPGLPTGRCEPCRSHGDSCSERAAADRWKGRRADLHP